MRRVHAAHDRPPPPHHHRLRPDRRHGRGPAARARAARRAPPAARQPLRPARGGDGAGRGAPADGGGGQGERWRRRRIGVRLLSGVGARLSPSPSAKLTSRCMGARARGVVCGGGSRPHGIPAGRGPACRPRGRDLDGEISMASASNTAGGRFGSTPASIGCISASALAGPTGREMQRGLCARRVERTMLDRLQPLALRATKVSVGCSVGIGGTGTCS